MGDELKVTQADEEAGEDARYLIRKGGYYYRPNAQGYTTGKAEAGRYTLEEAIKHSHPNGPDGPRDGITYELDADSGMSGEAVEQAEWFWNNLPTGNRKWTSLQTFEKALVCHTLAAWNTRTETQSQATIDELVGLVRQVHEKQTIDEPLDLDWYSSAANVLAKAGGQS